MNIVTYSPALTLLYVFLLLWILMEIDPKSFNRTQRILVPLITIFLCISNHLLRELVDSFTYGKLLIFCMHIPTFFLFLYIGKRGIIKTAFMILTATVFTAPTIFIGNFVRRTLFEGSPQALLLSNIISYALMLLLVQLIFRSGFNYLLTYGDNRLFLLFSLIPFVFYIYVFAAVNQDFSALTTPAGYIVRILPTAEVFLFYFLIPYVYKSLNEKQILKSAQTALQLKLTSAESQITLLNETNTKMAIYRHDIRHQLLLIDGLLCNNQPQQALEFIKTILADLDAITPHQFCENKTVNLLCSAYDSTAQRLGVHLRIKTLLPANLPLSDTELCSVVSNGLENALLAASHPDIMDKWVNFYCEVKNNKLLLQIQNPYIGQVVMRNGLPVSSKGGHGYGCHSIQSIIQKNGGLSSFETENSIFTLRLFLPLTNTPNKQNTNAANL